MIRIDNPCVLTVAGIEERTFLMCVHVCMCAPNGGYHNHPISVCIVVYCVNTVRAAS